LVLPAYLKKLYRKRFAKRAVVGLAVLAVVAGSLLLPAGSGDNVSAATPDFRIIAISDHDGQLLVEVEHFKVDGSFDYFENYLWQGREGKKFPREKNEDGLFLLANGRIAPFRAGTPATPALKQYLPERQEWKRQTTPFMEDKSILDVIQKIHDQRKDWTPDEWPQGLKRGQSRLIEKPIPYNARDADGIGNLLAKFSHLVARAYVIDDADTLLAYNGALPPVNTGLGLVEYGTVSTFYPDSSPESTSVDGHSNEATDAAWATIRADAGDQSTDTSTRIEAKIRVNGAGTQWTLFARATHLYDTSSLPDGDLIVSATQDFKVGAVLDNLVEAQSMSLVASAPASNTAVVNGDYARLGSTKFATDIPIASMTANASTNHSFTLNASGLAAIDATGITKLGYRIASDADNSEPTVTADKGGQVEIASAEEADPGDTRPSLIVTHISITAAITGTIGDGATEQEVRDGGTIIITLTNDTWVASGSAFDNQRQNIIDNISAGGSQEHGWNAQVRSNLDVTSVARTSGTVVTVTIDADDVNGYNISSNETITVTVPNAALVLGASDVTATPTIAISFGSESAAITGTLGGSGGTPANIVAGGKTIIITLTNTKWAASGATFNATRQAILNGIESNMSDANGWDSLAFAVGDVVRTSDTVVTITLTAESAYAIPETEVIEVQVTADAIGGRRLIATPTFAITPSFQTSGTRVSTAIDLSSVTDVAYCAIGWEATTPTNTTVAIATSVNGGTSYSDATNGSCPTGITVGESLSTITDFRVRVTLTTTDTSATPLITALGLIVEDSTGQELYYQLNDTPSATISDRSGSGNTGTMSFPVQASGVSSTTDPLTTTKVQLSTQQALAAPNLVSEVTGSATNNNLFNQNEVGFDGLPGKGLVDAMAAASDGLPTRFVWFIFLGLTIVGVGALAVVLSQSLLVAAISMASTIGFWLAVGDGLLPGWIIFVFVPIAGVLILVRPGKLAV
jgi:hypothetical protein